MEKAKIEKEQNHQINNSMNDQIISSINSYPYVSQKIQTMNNFQKLGILNSLQTVKTSSHHTNNISDIMQQQQALSRQEISDSPKSNSLQKNQDNINLLVTAVMNLFYQGKIDMDYLKGKTETKKTKSSNIKSNANNNTSDSSCVSSTQPTTKNLNQNQKSKLNQRISDFFPNSINSNLNNTCENPLCHYIFNSIKEKRRISIKGMKTQERKLCEKCCEAVDKSNFCYYCNAIYRDELTDNAVWVKCEFCCRWVHVDCEVTKGKKYSTKEELGKVNDYMCPVCTIEKAEKQNSENKLKKKLLNKKRKVDSIEYQKNKSKRKEIKSEKCSELLKDVQMIETIKETQRERKS